LDAEVSKALSQKHQWKYSSSSLILEGGAMEFNGRGLAMTTRPCLDGKNRNPYGLHQIKTEICEHLNLDELIVFRDGLAGDHTDGHIDNLVRFVGERKVLMPNPNEASINADLLLEVFNQCRSWRHPTEEWALDVDFLPSLDPLVYGKEQLPRSYMNFIFLNGALLLPFYGESMDTLAQEKLSIQFPDRDVIGIDCRLLIQEGGALHCMTRQQPK
jgi:agmatine deiminase